MSSASSNAGRGKAVTSPYGYRAPQRERLGHARLIANPSRRVDRLREELVGIGVFTRTFGHLCLSLQYSSGNEARLRRVVRDSPEEVRRTCGVAEFEVREPEVPHEHALQGTSTAVQRCKGALLQHLRLRQVAALVSQLRKLPLGDRCCVFTARYLRQRTRALR
jgi:hypothetical protein